MAEYKSYEEYIAHLKGARSGFNDPKMLSRLDIAIHPASHLTAYISAGMAAILFIGLMTYFNARIFSSSDRNPFNTYIFQPKDPGAGPVINYIFSE
jgi:hypothetical protein